MLSRSGVWKQASGSSQRGGAKIVDSLDNEVGLLSDKELVATKEARRIKEEKKGHFQRHKKVIAELEDKIWSNSREMVKR